MKYVLLHLMSRRINQFLNAQNTCIDQSVQLQSATYLHAKNAAVLFTMYFGGF